MKRLEAIACPLPRDEIDTDALLPVSENSRLSATGFGDALFAAWRYKDITARVADPDFILNHQPFDRAEILIAGRNMGCGSSRESAVWALRDYGFKAVLAISFNETFEQNCVANGLWPLRLDADAIAAIAAFVTTSPSKTIRIDFDARTVQAGKSYAFILDAYYGRLLGEGLTEDALLERYRSAILTRIETLGV